jgi:hypothetical protein
MLLIGMTGPASQNRWGGGGGGGLFFMLFTLGINTSFQIKETTQYGTEGENQTSAELPQNH